MTASNEFQAKLTRKFVDCKGQPLKRMQRWRLLQLKILVSEPEVGTGMELVHPQQTVDCLGQFCQQRMDANPEEVNVRFFSHRFLV